MNTLFEHATRHFQQRLSLSLEELLEPIDAGQPAGSCAKSGGVYQAIQHARREEDPRLPQGPWQHERKRADWKAVAGGAAEALRHRSKDLQLAAWLLEAQLHRHGLAGLAPGLVLIDELVRRFGDQLHPQDPDGGTVHRANVLRWINRKLLPVLKQVPLTAAGGEREFGWADREVAWRNEQLKSAGQAEPGDVLLQDVTAALARTASAHLLAQRDALAQALAAAGALARTVDQCFGQERPSLAALLALVEQMKASVEAELNRRGELRPAEAEVPAEAVAADDAPQAAPARPDAPDREQAYALLEHTAQRLLRSDPHSPAPYLVLRAVQWGRLDTAALYEELFIRKGGQLNVFELLGLQAQQEPAPTE
jgi:type VI secretion system protein ImpA